MKASASQLRRVQRDQERRERIRQEQIVRARQEAKPIEDRQELRQAVRDLADAWGLTKRGEA